MNPFSHGNFTEGLFEASKAICLLTLRPKPTQHIFDKLNLSFSIIKMSASIMKDILMRLESLRSKDSLERVDY